MQKIYIMVYLQVAVWISRKCHKLCVSTSSLYAWGKWVYGTSDYTSYVIFSTLKGNCNFIASKEETKCHFCFQHYCVQLEKRFKSHSLSIEKIGLKRPRLRYGWRWQIQSRHRTSINCMSWVHCFLEQFMKT